MIPPSKKPRANLCAKLGPKLCRKLCRIFCPRIVAQGLFAFLGLPPGIWSTTKHGYTKHGYTARMQGTDERHGCTDVIFRPCVISELPVPHELAEHVRAEARMYARTYGPEYRLGGEMLRVTSYELRFQKPAGGRNLSSFVIRHSSTSFQLFKAF